MKTLSIRRIVLSTLSMLISVSASAATCEFNVPVKPGVFESEFKVVGTGTTSEKALADAINKCFSVYQGKRGKGIVVDDATLDALDLCGNPPGC